MSPHGMDVPYQPQGTLKPISEGNWKAIFGGKRYDSRKEFDCVPSKSNPGAFDLYDPDTEEPLGTHFLVQ